jgi:sugar phosphate isomerase/epimerase
MMSKLWTGKIDRRRWLGYTAATPAAAVLLGRPLEGRSSKKGNMRVSLAAYSVRQALTGGRMDLFRFIDWCAEMGLAGAELTSYYFKENFDAAYLRNLRLHAFRNGVTVSGTAIRNNFCLPPGPEKDRQIAQVHTWIDHAAELFAPHIRIFAGDLPRDAEKSAGITWTADGIKAVLDHAEARGVVIGLENHGGITARADDLLAICREVGEHPWFGINLDTGNYRSDPYGEVAATAPLAVNVQVKVEMWDGERQVPADLDRVVEILIESGYRGWVALEYEAEGDPFEEIPGYVRRLKSMLEV